MLCAEVDDPVNQGVPSTLEIEAQWFAGSSVSALLQRVSLPFRTWWPSPTVRRKWKHSSQRWQGEVMALVLDLVKGTGFPPEANVGRGLRWRQFF